MNTNNYKDLTTIINKHKNKTAYVCALGPSLKQFLSDIENNKEKNIVISCNDYGILTNINADYWVLANSELTIQKIKNKINNLPQTTLVYADSVDATPYKWVEENLIHPYIGYDQRHFNGEKCYGCSNNCGNIRPNRKTIQELLQEYTGYNERYGTGDTVALHMLSLSILLGCKKIFLLGVDLNNSLGYVNTNFKNMDSFGPYLNNILNDFKIIYESAKNVGSDIINCSSVSPLKSFIPTINSF